jgi:hypothetical protein
MDTKNPEIEKPIAGKAVKEELENDITYQNNKRDLPTTAVERNKALEDFYNNYDPNAIVPSDKKAYEQYMAGLGDKEKAFMAKGLHFYQLDFANKGGLVMPLIIQFNFEDGTSEVKRIPAEIFRLNDQKVSKVFALAKPVVSVELDPQEETADTNRENNFFPRKAVPSRFELFKQSGGGRWSGGSGMNPMQKAKAETKN